MKKSTVGFDFPMYVFTLAMPVGFFLTSIRLLKDILRHAREDGINRWYLKDPHAIQSDEKEISETKMK